MDQNYTRKRKEKRLRARLAELYSARNELSGITTWSLSDRSLKKPGVNVWSAMDEGNTIDAQIVDIEQKLLLRRG